MRKILSGVATFIYEENREAIDQHATNLIVWGYSKMTVTPEGKFECAPVNGLERND